MKKKILLIAVLSLSVCMLFTGCGKKDIGQVIGDKLLETSTEMALKVNEELVKEYNYWVEHKDEFVAEMMKDDPKFGELKAIDPFEYLEIEYSGISPYLEIDIDNKADDEIFGGISFEIKEPKDTYELGDEFVVYISDYHFATKDIREFGYKFESIEKTIKIEDREYYIESFNELSEDDVKKFDNLVEYKLSDYFDEFNGVYSIKTSLDGHSRNYNFNGEVLDITNVELDKRYFYNKLREKNDNQKGISSYGDMSGSDDKNGIIYQYKLSGVESDEGEIHDLYFMFNVSNIIKSVEGKIEYDLEAINNGKFVDYIFEVEIDRNYFSVGKHEFVLIEYEINENGEKILKEVSVDKEKEDNEDVELNYSDIVIGNGFTIDNYYSDEESKMYASKIIGKEIPNIKWVDEAGTEHSISELEGKYILEFFMTTCVYCNNAIPEVDAFREAHPDIKVVSLSFDTGDLSDFNEKGENAFYISNLNTDTDVIEFTNNIPFTPGVVYVEDGICKLLTFGNLTQSSMEDNIEIVFGK